MPAHETPHLQLMKRLTRSDASPHTAAQARLTKTISPLVRTPPYEHAYCNARTLVEKGGADTRARAKLQHEPLHVACLGNWGEVVQFLLSEGRVDVEAVDKNGMRCLHLAVHRNRLEAIRELLKHG